MTPEGKALKQAYQWEARAQWKGALEDDIDVSITLYFGSKRKADLDNFNKLSLDALTGVAYSDDSQISTLTIARGYDKVRPRIEIEIK
jgi:Holliday junction resolvase RusA-like endonuclease